MPFKFFTVSIRDDGTVEQELNAFLIVRQLCERTCQRSNLR